MGLGSALMTVGAIAFSLMLWQQVSCWVFLAGAIAFGVIQSSQRYDGTNITLRRLKNIQNLACLALVVAGLLMVDTANMLLRPLFNSHVLYLQTVYNKWVVLMLIGCVLQLYTTLRISHILNEKEKKY